MRRNLIVWGAGASIAAWAALAAEPAPEPKPLRKGLVESVKTELVLFDVVVLDRAGKVVSGLTKDDFDLTIAGRSVPLVAVDTPDAGSEKPSLTLLFDYQHLAPVDRTRAVEMARKTIAEGGAAGSPVSVGVLTGSLRVEQAFTGDTGRTDSALTAMERDSSLFPRIFEHYDEDGFVAGMTALLDLLGTYSGPKAVVLYSDMKDLPLEDQFREIAAQAAASRCTIYPVNVRGLQVDALPPSAAPPPPWAEPSDWGRQQADKVLASQATAGGCG
ncbi:MAG TPA: hypothetical protein VFV19_08865 [Candidatus Polarisedimenticolaceae bacterium]|nr:hypothetical protein [Candidatus Polarisedimenticolaceae bacterium]